MVNKSVIILVIVFFLFINLVSANHQRILDLNFDETSGTICYDGALGNNGTYHNNPNLTIAGVYNTGVKFDGVDDYISFSPNINYNLNSTDEILVCFSINTFGDIQNNLQILDYYDESNLGYEIHGADDEIHFDIDKSLSGKKDVQTTYDFKDSIFHKVCFFGNNSVMISYVDGSLDNTQLQGQSGVVNPANNTLYLGSEDGIGEFIDDLIDDMCIIKDDSINITYFVDRYETMGCLGLTDCIENWVLNDTLSACEVTNNRTLIYDDLNSCGTTDDLPVSNGTIVSCNYCTSDWDCDNFNASCGGGLTMIDCLSVNYTDDTCCLATGLDEDCIYSGNVSDYDKYCGEIDLTLIVPYYPYVDLNVSYPMQLLVTQDNSTFTGEIFNINVSLPNGSSLVFPFEFDNPTQLHDLELIFTEIGDYPFVIYADYPYDDIPEITGTLIVRNPCIITIKGFETKNQQTKPYDNDFAYVIAEKTEKQYYDKILEKFIVPLLFKGAYRTDVFYAPYIDGEAELKLWDNETNYAVRLIDGDIGFDGQYAFPNITDSYGTNIFVDIYTWECNGNDEEIRVLFAEHDIFPYRVLFNWVFIIGLGLIAITSIFLFFVIPQYSQISIIFGLGFTLMLVAGRVTLFLIFGW